MESVRMATAATDVVAGTFFGVAVGLAYIVLLDEPGRLFYPFAGLVFLGGPLVAGAAGASRCRGQRMRGALVPGAAVFCILLGLSFTAYAILPHFDRTSVELPEPSTGFGSGPHPPPGLAYPLPGRGDGVLIARDERTAVVAVVDFSNAPHPGTVHVVDARDNRTLRRMDFPDSTIMATIDGGVVYLYNDKLGYLIDARSGADVETILVIDNYGGLSATDRPVLPGAPGGRRSLEPPAVVSSWCTDGTVRSRARLTMNGTAGTWFVNGETREIIEL